MKNRFFAIGLVFLFVFSSVIPISIGDNFNNKDSSQVNISYFSSNYNYPPEEEWNRTYNIPSKGHSSGNCIQETPDDGYIVTGYAGYGYWYSLYLLKVDSQGNELWSRIFGPQVGKRYDKGYWVEVTSDNGYIIVGQNGFTDNKAWLIKTDSNGNEQWNKTYGEIAGDPHGYCVKKTIDDGYIITGDISSYIWLFKTDDCGNEIWSKTYGDLNHGVGCFITLTNDGGYIITGYEPNAKLILIKTDENGNVEWVNRFGIYNHNNHGEMVQQTSDGGYIIGGYTGSYSAGHEDYWLIKTDENGIELWNRTFGSSSNDFGLTVIQTPDGGYLIGGEKNWPEKFWLVRTNVNGNIVWDNIYVPWQNAKCNCVQKTKDNGYIATGEINPFDAPECIIIKIKPDIINQPPNSPNINGPTKGIPGKSYDFSFKSIDPDDDKVRYIIDWGDGNNNTTAFNPSDKSVTITHIWSIEGEFVIKVKAEDTFGLFSSEVTLSVSIPRTRALYNSNWLSFLEQFPISKIVFSQLI